MRRRFIVRHRATIDVADICDYLTSQSQSTAVRFVEGYLEAIQLLRSDPTIGHRLQLPDQASTGGYWYKRVQGYEKYLLIYRFDESRTEVLRVAHASRDLPSLLDDRS